jgi:hypothetical protein
VGVHGRGAATKDGLVGQVVVDAPAGQEQFRVPQSTQNPPASYYRRCQVGARGNDAVAAVRWPQVACPVRAVLAVMADVGVKDRDAMIVVATDTDEPRWNRQQALAALAAVGRHHAVADRERMFPLALQAAGGDLDDGTDDDAQAGGPLNRSRVIIRDPTLRTSGLLAAAALASTPGQYESVIDLAYDLMPHASLHQANRIAQTLALLPDDGRALLDPRSLASHESESRPTIPTPFAHGMIPMIRVEIRSLRQCGASPPSLSQQTPT